MATPRPSRQSMLEQELAPAPLAPGFSVLPNGELMYQVATDYPKQMASIMADYEARAGAPRYNPFGESPDSPRRLEQELVEPFRDVFNASQPAIKTTPPRYFETGGGIVQVDPLSGKATTVFQGKPTNLPEDKKRSIDAGILQDEIKNLNSLRLKSKFDRPAGWDDEKIDSEIAKAKASIEALFSPQVVTNTPVATAPTPRMAIGGLDSELAPIFGGSTSTNAPSGVSRWVKDSSGKLVRVQ